MEVDALTDRSLADNESQVMHAGRLSGGENAAVIDADALADVWNSPTGSPEGAVIDANALADAWRSSEDEGPAVVDVDTLAAAWNSEGSVSPRQLEADTGEVAAPSRQVVTVDVEQLAALWSVSSEDSASGSASSSATSSSGESDNENMAIDLIPVSLYPSLADMSNTSSFRLHR